MIGKIKDFQLKQVWGNQRNKKLKNENKERYTTRNKKGTSYNFFKHRDIITSRWVEV